MRTARRRFVRLKGKRLGRRLNAFQESQSLVPTTPLFDVEQFPFVRDFETNWLEIRKELDTILAERAKLPLLHEISPDNVAISSAEWQIFMLYGLGRRTERGCAACPETTRMLERVPGLQNAWFSILAPGAKIPKHKGITKGLIRVHLGLVVPDEREQCRIRVRQRNYTWQEGRVLIFDDTFAHRVRNRTHQDRVVLIFDFLRPMRWPGRVATHLFLAGMRMSGFLREGMRNQNDWEARYYEGHTQ